LAASKLKRLFSDFSVLTCFKLVKSLTFRMKHSLLLNMNELRLISKILIFPVNLMGLS
jgi:hypothetical protein